MACGKYTHTKDLSNPFTEYADMVICVSHHTLSNQPFSLITQQYGEIPKRLLSERNSCIAKTVAYIASFVLIFFHKLKAAVGTVLSMLMSRHNVTVYF